MNFIFYTGTQHFNFFYDAIILLTLPAMDYLFIYLGSLDMVTIHLHKS